MNNIVLAKKSCRKGNKSVVMKKRKLGKILTSCIQQIQF